MTEMNNGRLAQVVFAMSEGRDEDKDWRSVSKQWTLSHIEYVPMEAQETVKYHCVCGHAISECCYVKHNTTQEELMIGNDCIGFFTSPELKIAKSGWASLRKLVADTENTTMNTSLLTVAKRFGIIKDVEMARYGAITRGKGVRAAFERDGDDFDAGRWNERAALNFRVREALTHPRQKCFCGEPAVLFPLAWRDGEQLSYRCGQAERCEFRQMALTVPIIPGFGRAVFCECTPPEPARLVHGKYGDFYGCSNWRDEDNGCGFRQSVKIEDDAAGAAAIMCTCTPPAKAKLKNGPRGEFYGCPNWRSHANPGCGFIQAGKMDPFFENTADVMCKCNPPQLARVVKGAFGRRHYGCPSWTRTGGGCGFYLQDAKKRK